MANLACEKEFQKATEEFKIHAGERAVATDLSSLIISDDRLRDAAIAYDDCMKGSHSGVKRIDPPKTPKKPSMSLDIEVGAYTPKPVEKTPQRNPNARQSDMPLDTPVGKYTPKPQQTQPRRTLNLKEAPIPLDTPVGKP